MIQKITIAFLAGISLWLSSCADLARMGQGRPAKKYADAGQAAPLRVMAYNIHHCNPPSRPDFIDVQAIVKTIQSQRPDLVALQEVDVHTTRSGPVNQARQIAAKLGMHYFFGKAIDYQGGAYGVAILSRYPLSDTLVHRLPTQAGTNGEPRILATARIQLPDGSFVRFGSTHLDAQRAHTNRQLQIEQIGTLAAKETLPFIIAGDFNAAPGTPVIATLDRHFKRTCQDCAPTIPVEKPTKAIDFIAYAPATGFSVISHQVIDEQYASDHLPVIAVLRKN